MCICQEQAKEYIQCLIITASSARGAEWELSRQRRMLRGRRHSCRPRRRSRYSAAAEEGEGYSDAEDYEDDLGSGSLGRDEAGRKKVGRPIAYKGDPNAPHLTEDERRRIKR